MKTLLLTLFISISSILYAQDTTYLQSLNNMNETEAKRFAATLGNNEYNILGTKQSTKSAYYVVYLTKDDKADSSDLKSCESCIKVVYYSYGKAPNKTYKFYKVAGDYDVLFPTWQTLFKPDATYQATLTQYDLQRIEDKTKNINFDFKPNNNTWQLQNWN